MNIPYLANVFMQIIAVEFALTIKHFAYTISVVNCLNVYNIIYLLI